MEIYWVKGINKQMFIDCWLMEISIDESYKEI